MRPEIKLCLIAVAAFCVCFLIQRNNFSFIVYVIYKSYETCFDLGALASACFFDFNVLCCEMHAGSLYSLWLIVVCDYSHTGRLKHAPLISSFA